jgi:uncharacterized lipoprotein YddW (UPF0748 family)
VSIATPHLARNRSLRAPFTVLRIVAPDALRYGSPAVTPTPHFRVSAINFLPFAGASRPVRLKGCARSPRRIVLARIAFTTAMILGLSACEGDTSTKSQGLPSVSAGPPTQASSSPLADSHAAPVSVAVDNAPDATTAAAPTTDYRGLWVLCEGSQRVLEHPERIPLLIEDALALGTTDLFVQVYRGGRAWYKSEQADAAPYRKALAAGGGVDPLAALIEQAHEAGLRVHAWVNVLSLSRNRNAPILQDLGSSAIHVDRRGRSILDYPASLELPAPDSDWYRVGTPGLYLDPGAPGVAERLVATFRELVAGYPKLDGLHLDYIRHPGVLPFVPGSRFGVGLDYGYGEASRLQFRRDTGVRGPYSNDSDPDPKHIVNSERWDAWRRDKVTALVKQIGEATAEVNKELRLSAAVISYVDRAYLSLAQDWRGWLEDDLLDFAVPMVYSKDAKLVRYQVEAFGKGPEAARIWGGIGVWLFTNQPERALEQLESVRHAGLGGDALFSYDSIVEARDATAPASQGTGGSPGTVPVNLFSALVKAAQDNTNNTSSTDKSLD